MHRWRERETPSKETFLGKDAPDATDKRNAVAPS